MRCNKRHRAVVMARRSGKTVMACVECFRTMIECKRPAPRAYYVSPYLKQSKKVAWDYVRELAKSGGPLFEVNNSELSIRFQPNGGKVILAGADNADALRGIYADLVVVDEVADCDPNLWPTIVRPALADRGGRGLLCGTPRGRMNLLYDLSKIDKDDREWAYFKYDAYEAGMLSADEIEATRRDMISANPGHGEALFQQEMLCSFNAALIGAIYGKQMDALQNEGRFTDVKYDSSLPVMTAWDLGFKDSTAIWYLQQVGSEIRAIEYEEFTLTSLPDILKSVLGKGYIYSEHYGPHDLRVREYGSGRSRRDIASDLGVEFTLAPNWSVEDGIEAVQGVLPHLWIDHRKADRGLECLVNYKFEFDDQQRCFKVRPLHSWASHGADALRIFAVARDNAMPDRAGNRSSNRWLV
jgi:phage terminase large subunit